MSVHFSLNEIRKVTIEAHKAHRHGVTSICMLETCSESICKPLKLIFKSHLVQKIFLSEKKGNISYKYKENRPSETVGLSYFSWYVVKFEYLIYDIMFLYVTEILLDKNFVYVNPPGCNPGNSQSNQHIKHVLALNIIMDLEKSSIKQTFLLNYNIKELFTNYSKIGSKKAS